jgi:hypothetical protein
VATEDEDDEVEDEGLDDDDDDDDEETVDGESIASSTDLIKVNILNSNVEKKLLYNNFRMKLAKLVGTKDCRKSVYKISGGNCL